VRICRSIVCKDELRQLALPAGDQAAARRQRVEVFTRQLGHQRGHQRVHWDADLVQRVPVPDSDLLVLQGLEVDGNAVGRADLVLAAVAPAAKPGLESLVFSPYYSFRLFRFRMYCHMSITRAGTQPTPK
jgi:hypothetical protein